MNKTISFLQEIEKRNLWENDFFLKRNDFLKTPRTTDTNIYFIEEGSLRIFITDDSEEQTIRFGYKNNLIVALDSFISEKPSDLSIQALKKTHIKAIGKHVFKKLIESSFELQKNWNEVLEQLVYQQLERERDLLTTSPTKRYKRVLQRSPQLFQEIPNKYIASYLRMTPETLSRIKKS